MAKRTIIASAGNVLPAAFAVLRSLGYEVSVTPDGKLCKAESANACLFAEDPLLLLGLVKLHEIRGGAWAPTDDEVEAFLAFDTRHSCG